MTTDARIRLQLDTSDAKSALTDLYGQMRRPPGVRVPGGGGYGPGGGSGGGFDVERLLRTLTGAFAAQQMAGTIVPASLGMGRDMMREALLGGAYGTVRGALAARDAVAEKFGVAHALGTMTQDDMDAQVDIENAIGAGFRAKSIAQAKAKLNGKTIGDIGEVTKMLVADALNDIPVLGQIKDLLSGISTQIGAAK